MHAARMRFAGLAVAISLTAVALILTNASPLCAQAWMSRQGNGSISVSYQDLFVRYHLFNRDYTGENRADLGHIFGRTVTASLDYSVLDRLALNVTVPYVSSKYVGVGPENPSIDDGSFHGNFQDLSVAARYQALRSPVTITPAISYSVPITNYPILGHTAIGNHLRSFDAGLYLGRTFEPFLPDAYIEANYFRAFGQKHVMHTATGDMVHKLQHNLIGLQIGYFITPSLSLAVAGSYEDTKGGIDWNSISSAEEGHSHDQFAAAIVRTAGGGVTYSITPSVDLQLSMAKVVSGANTHQANTYSFGTSWDLASILPMLKKNAGPGGRD